MGWCRKARSLWVSPQPRARWACFPGRRQLALLPSAHGIKRITRWGGHEKQRDMPLRPIDQHARWHARNNAVPPPTVCSNATMFQMSRTAAVNTGVTACIFRTGRDTSHSHVSQQPTPRSQPAHGALLSKTVCLSLSTHVPSRERPPRGLMGCPLMVLGPYRQQRGEGACACKSLSFLKCVKKRRGER